MSNINDLYLNYDKIMSYQRFMTILFGGRGIGKTYGIKKFIIKDFLKNGNQFIWIRRYKSERSIAKSGFFEKIKYEFPDHTLEVRGNNIYIDGKLAGVLVALTQSSVNKGNDILNNPKTAVFDEYVVADLKHNGYLNNEMRLLFDLFETFFRTRQDCRVYFLSNNVSTVNPLFAYFNIEFKEGQTKWVDKDIYCEMLKTKEELIKLKNETPIGRITKKYDETYYNYNVNNAVLNDSQSFIKQKDEKAYQCMTISFKEKHVYIYKSRDPLYGGYNFFVCNNGQSDYRVHYTFDLDQASDDVLFVDKTDLSLPIRDLSASYKRGRLYFETQELKSLMTENLKKFF